MSKDFEQNLRHLVVGEQTRDIRPGSIIVGGDPSAVRYSVREVKEDGRLNVEIKDLLTGETRVAPMVPGTPVIVED